MTFLQIPPESADPCQNSKSETIYNEFAIILQQKYIHFQQHKPNSDYLNANNSVNDSYGIDNKNDKDIYMTDNRSITYNSSNVCH